MLRATRKRKQDDGIGWGHEGRCEILREETGMMRSCRSEGKYSEVDLGLYFILYGLGNHLWVSSRRVTCSEFRFTAVPLSFVDNVLCRDYVRRSVKSLVQQKEDVVWDWSGERGDREK